MRSNLRWCSDGLEFACWNGEIIRIGLHHRRFDREIIAWTAVSGAGISGSDVRGMMLEAVEKRFGSEMVGTCGEWDCRCSGLPVAEFDTSNYDYKPAVATKPGSKHESR